MSTDERRKIPRFRLKGTARANPRSAETGVPEDIHGDITDISEGGVRFEADTALEVGTEVMIRFAVGDQTVEAAGQVVHVATTGSGSAMLGIKFTNLSPLDKRFIEKYCQIRPKQDKDKL